MSDTSIRPINRTLSDATTPGKSGPGSNGNERVLCISQSSSITEASLSDYLMSYLGHLLGESYPSAGMQPVYSTAPANWTKKFWSSPRLHKKDSYKLFEKVSLIFLTWKN